MISVNLESIFRNPAGTKENFIVKGRIANNQEFCLDGYGYFEVTGSLNRLDDGVSILGESEAKASVCCDRCQKDFRLSKNFPIDIFLSNNQIVHLKNRDFILDEALNEGLILATPIKKLCKVSCKGLCPECGQDLNLQKCNCKKHIPPKTFSKLLKG